MNKFIIATIVLCASLSACVQTKTVHSAQEKEPSKLAWQYGKVVHLSFEGGFWGIVTANGKKYLPLNLDKSFKADGKNIRFLGNIESDVMTIQQWGTPFQLSRIEETK